MSGGRHAPAALPPEKRPGTHSIGGWVGSRADQVECGKSRAHQDSIPVRPTRREWLHWLRYHGPQFQQIYLCLLTDAASNLDTTALCITTKAVIWNSP
jgi:hypothetical protein